MNTATSTTPAPSSSRGGCQTTRSSGRPPPPARGGRAAATPPGSLPMFGWFSEVTCSPGASGATPRSCPGGRAPSRATLRRWWRPRRTAPRPRRRDPGGRRAATLQALGLGVLPAERVGVHVQGEHPQVLPGLPRGLPGPGGAGRAPARGSGRSRRPSWSPRTRTAGPPRTRGSPACAPAWPARAPPTASRSPGTPASGPPPSWRWRLLLPPLPLPAQTCSTS